MMRILFFLLALVGLFAFPWPYEVLLIFVASCFTPIFGIALGITADALYYTHGFPWATVTGIIGSALGLLVDRYIKGRITDLSYL